MIEKILSFPFIKHRKIYYIICVAIIIVGLAIGMFRGFNMGIDFIGGTMIQIDMGQEVPVDDIKALLNTVDGLDGDVVHAGAANEQIIIKTIDSLDTDARARLVDALTAKYGLTDDAILSAENISPSVGDTLKQNSAKAVAAAIILMLIYIAVRFKWQYGVAAIVALANASLITIAFYGTFNIPINSPFIAAILTILGYGINDTIVIFDRIRENSGNSAKRGSGLEDLIDKSIHQTLGRSIMTSLTTVIVMIPLLVICGDTIRAFILPLMVGIIASTCSSIFIATSVYFEINKATDTAGRKNYTAKTEKSKKETGKAKA